MFNIRVRVPIKFGSGGNIVSGTCGTVSRGLNTCNPRRRENEVQTIFEEIVAEIFKLNERHKFTSQAQETQQVKYKENHTFHTAENQRQNLESTQKKTINGTENNDLNES